LAKLWQNAAKFGKKKGEQLSERKMNCALGGVCEKWKEKREVETTIRSGNSFFFDDF